MKRPALVALVSLSLLGLGVAARATPSQPRALTPRTLVSVAGHRTSEFTTATDPRNSNHLVAAAMDWDGPDGTVSCRSFVSRDGGASWAPGAAVRQFTDSRQHVDPWVTIGPDGVTTMSCIAMTATASGLDRQLLLSTSGDGGATWSAASRVPTSVAPTTVTKDSLLATPDGQLYACFGGDALTVARSADRGRTWSRPTVFSGLSATCNGMAYGRGGTVIVNFQGAGGSVPATSFGTIASTNRGASWSSPSVGGTTGTAPSEPPFPQAAAPSIAVSPRTGAVLLAAQRYTSSATPQTDHAVAILVRAARAGAPYQALAVPSFPSKACASCNQVHPTLVFDAQGRLALQVTLSDDQSLVRETWFAVSRDEGLHWLAPVLLGATDASDSYLSPNDLAPAPTAVGTGVIGTGDPAGTAVGLATTTIWPYFHRDGGEYFGLAATPRGFVAIWVDHYGDGRNAIWSRIVSTG